MRFFMFNARIKCTQIYRKGFLVYINHVLARFFVYFKWLETGTIYLIIGAIKMYFSFALCCSTCGYEFVEKLYLHFALNMDFVCE